MESVEVRGERGTLPQLSSLATDDQLLRCESELETLQVRSKESRSALQAGKSPSKEGKLKESASKESAKEARDT